jgi:hypothetical protein
MLSCITGALTRPPSLWDPLARVFDAWGFDRCLWGTENCPSFVSAGKLR